MDAAAILNAPATGGHTDLSDPTLSRIHIGRSGRIPYGRFDPSLEDFGIYSATPDGTGEQQLTSVPSEGSDWSPDGTKIAFDFVDRQEEGESLDQRLSEERPDRPPLDLQLAIEDFDAPDEEKQLVGQADLEHDHFAAPEEAAMSVRGEAPGAVDHPDDDDDGDGIDVERSDGAPEEA